MAADSGIAVPFVGTLAAPLVVPSAVELVVVVADPFGVAVAGVGLNVLASLGECVGFKRNKINSMN